MRLYITLFLALILLISPVFADAAPPEEDVDVLGNIQTAMCELLDTVRGVVNIVIIMMIILAAITYAGGQAMGAETRAKATVWATTMVVGAVVAVLINVLLPSILVMVDDKFDPDACGSGSGGGGGQAQQTQTSYSGCITACNADCAAKFNAGEFTINPTNQLNACKRACPDLCK
ncbi:hypothetical protein KAW38_04780 [Candidatus Micrarchaeota archaeon]|nr:hypothetical protein [Candidatus Micrarchaeota archaeon]